MEYIGRSLHGKGTAGILLLLSVAAGACGSEDPGPSPSHGSADAAAADATSVTPVEDASVAASAADAGRVIASASPDGGALRDAGRWSNDAMARDASLASDADAGRTDRDADGAASPDGTSGMQRDECGLVPTSPLTAATPKAVVVHGLAEYHTAENNQFVGVRATLTVPAKPPPSGIIFVWPGTQALPDGPTYQPVGGGVLQPVLTWGSSCVPGSLPGHATWWISPVYVNEETSIPELRGCHGGPVITAAVGDRLDLEMRLDKTMWYQKVVDRNSQRSTEFNIDLRGQLQQRALFWIELKTAAKPTEDLVFEDIVLTMRDPDPGACALNNRGMNDYVSASRVSADGLSCCIDRIVLRAEGVPATTKNP